jgi:hypothetical protein
LKEDLELGTSSDPGQKEADELSDALSPDLEMICEEDFGILDLPRKHSPRAVPNVCAICLEIYKPDETVVWSSNIECSHAFHQDCILDYAVKLNKAKDNVPCPCCRQDFMGLPSAAEQKEGASDTETLNAIMADTSHLVSVNV